MDLPCGKRNRLVRGSAHLGRCDLVYRYRGKVCSTCPGSVTFWPAHSNKYLSVARTALLAFLFAINWSDKKALSMGLWGENKRKTTFKPLVGTSQVVDSALGVTAGQTAGQNWIALVARAPDDVEPTSTKLSGSSRTHGRVLHRVGRQRVAAVCRKVLPSCV